MRDGAYSSNQMTRIDIIAFQFFYPKVLQIQCQFYKSNTPIQHSFVISKPYQNQHTDLFC